MVEVVSWGAAKERARDTVEATVASRREERVKVERAREVKAKEAKEREERVDQGLIPTNHWLLE